MKKPFLLIAALASLICVQQAQGQSVGPSTLNASGGTATISGNIYDWSVGEMTLVSTFSTANVIVTQGVLQPEDNPVGVAQTTKLSDHLRVYPNPATSVVNLEYTSSGDGNLIYRLMDLNGKVIMERSTPVKQGISTEKVNLEGLANASYMLEVSSQAAGAAKETTSFKIQKIQ